MPKRTAQKIGMALRMELRDFCWQVGYDPARDVVRITQLLDRWEAAMEAAAGLGDTDRLQFLLHWRLECAKTLMPYLYPKLTTVKVQGDAAAPIQIQMIDYREDVGDADDSPAV